MASSKVPRRFITPLTNAEIAAGAAIDTSKLAAALEILMRDGSVAMTGNLAMGNNKVTGLATATNNDEAVNLGQLNTRLEALNSIYRFKEPARVATTANIANLATGAPSTVDGVTLVAGNRVLVKNQSTASANGVYTVTTVGTGANGVWARATDFDLWAEIPGALVGVEQGTTQADTLWLCTADSGGTLGTTSITWLGLPMSASTGGYTASNFVTNEIPSGTVNGSNVTFTLANTPVAGSEEVINGIPLRSGAGNDYTISGATITMLSAPLTGEEIRVHYRKA